MQEAERTGANVMPRAALQSVVQGIVRPLYVKGQYIMYLSGATDRRALGLHKTVGERGSSHHILAEPEQLHEPYSSYFARMGREGI